MTAYEEAKTQSSRSVDSDTLISSATITANFTNVEEESRESSEKMIEFSVSNGSDFQPKSSTTQSEKVVKGAVTPPLTTPDSDVLI